MGIVGVDSFGFYVFCLRESECGSSWGMLKFLWCVYVIFLWIGILYGELFEVEIVGRLNI